ncbi:hypothetical protein APY04_0170 [Hyphomicrobium sulfonivorans]|uniref:Uncharacterized protein n=1 Tax=Hyphomicrobium sulfonivorans TaxID=121290 RepID=A0A109BPF4_HYPSL|nr:hypothetical protein [Hyphomicrobium sulfonivorans]KWT72376.1 hypothetical protein APY04_0170 [Hyphomicrobium sulfonivorans]
MRFDIHSVCAVQNVFGPAALTADNTPAPIDLQGFHAAEIVLGVGIGGITFTGENKIEFVLTHCDTSDGEYTPVTLDDVLGVPAVASGIIKALTTAHGAAATYRVGYRGGKRFLKLLADFSGTHGTATPLHATVVKMHPEVSPVADAA